jgi:acyl-CoA thioester hydrolase
MAPRIAIELEQVRQLPLTHQQEIPPEYLDEMNHMNVMWYTHLFDRGIYSTFDLMGIDDQFMEDHQSGSFALESHIRYLSEIRVGHQASVYTRIVAVTAKRFQLMHFMVNETKQDLAATFEVVVAYIDMQTRRMAVIPDDLAERIAQLASEHEALPWPSPLSGIMRA